MCRVLRVLLLRTTGVDVLVLVSVPIYVPGRLWSSCGVGVGVGGEGACAGMRLRVQGKLVWCI